jgi:LmbE family N-acetylglucosaminyl deacetylase
MMSFLLDTRESRLSLINAMRVAEPDVVFCHWKNDYNPDHSISGHLVDECVSMAGIPNIETEAAPTRKPIPHVYYMDTPAGVNFSPELYVDITSTFERKIEMVRAHASQDAWMEKLFGHDLQSFLEIPAKYRGLQAGVPLAEAFAPSQRWGRTFQRHYLPDCLGPRDR